MNENERLVIHAEKPEELKDERIATVLSREARLKLEDLLRGKMAKMIEVSVSPPSLRVIATFSPKHVEIASILMGLFDHVHVSTLTARDDGQQFELIYHLLLDYQIPCDVVVEIPRSEGELKPKVPSMTAILPAANIYEREVHDLMGIEFTGHPDLRRLILPENWPEDQFPLRKDFEVKSPRGD